MTTETKPQVLVLEDRTEIYSRTMDLMRVLASFTALVDRETDDPSEHSPFYAMFDHPYRRGSSGLDSLVKKSLQTSAKQVEEAGLRLLEVMPVDTLDKQAIIDVFTKHSRFVRVTETLSYQKPKNKKPTSEIRTYWLRPQTILSRGRIAALIFGDKYTVMLEDIADDGTITLPAPIEKNRDNSVYGRIPWDAELVSQVLVISGSPLVQSAMGDH